MDVVSVQCAFGVVAGLKVFALLLWSFAGLLRVQR